MLLNRIHTVLFPKDLFLGSTWSLYPTGIYWENLEICSFLTVCFPKYSEPLPESATTGSLSGPLCGLPVLPVMWAEGCWW